MEEEINYHAIVIGASAGGLYALASILENLPVNYPLPIIIVQHRIKDQKSLLEEVLQSKCKLMVKQADEKEKIEGGCVFVAPPDYHLLIESDYTFSLSSDLPVSYSRPSIDVLFESAAEVYKTKLIGVILTGANSDGTNGFKAINHYGGLTIAQSPEEALFPLMPSAAIAANVVSKIMTVAEMHRFLLKTAGYK